MIVAVTISIPEIIERNGAFATHENYTWLEKGEVLKEDDRRYSIKFRIFDLVGRLDDFSSLSVIESTGDSSTFELKAMRRSRFSAELQIHVTPSHSSAVPQLLEMNLTGGAPRRLIVPVQFVVSTPPSPEWRVGGEGD